MALPECATILKRDLLFCVDEGVRILFDEETGRKSVLVDDHRRLAAGLKAFDCFLPAAAWTTGWGEVVEIVVVDGSGAGELSMNVTILRREDEEEEEEAEEEEFFPRASKVGANLYAFETPAPRRSSPE